MMGRAGETGSPYWVVASEETPFYMGGAGEEESVILL